MAVDPESLPAVAIVDFLSEIRKTYWEKSNLTMFSRLLSASMPMSASPAFSAREELMVIIAQFTNF
jgi:hypothetical protein